MKFNDEAERAAWSSAWDATASGVSNIQPGAGERVCTRFADAKVGAMREREADPAAAIKSEAPGTIPGVKPPPQPQRSERGALERVRACVKGLGETRISKETILIYIDAELARQPADELPEKVKAVVEAARAVVEGWGRDALCKEYGALRAAVKALDGGGA